MPAWIGLAPTGWIMTVRVALAPPVPRIALTHASRYRLRSACACGVLPPPASFGSLKHSSIRWLLNVLNALAIWVQTAVTSAATPVAADICGKVTHPPFPSASWWVLTKTYMPASTAHCAVCFTLFIQAESMVYAGPLPMWFVQVTAIRKVLKPAACTPLISVWLGVGLPKLVSLGDASNELPRFHPGAISLAVSSEAGVPAAPPVALPPRPPAPVVPAAAAAPPAPD